MSLSPASWKSRGSYTSTEEQRQQFNEEGALIADEDINTLAVHWTDDEVMPLQEPYEARSFRGAVARGAAQLVMLALALKTAAAGLAGLRRSGYFYVQPEKELSCWTA